MSDLLPIFGFHLLGELRVARGGEPLPPPVMAENAHPWFGI